MSGALKAARPRPAASLVATRRDPETGATQVLMGRRRPRARFAPDVWVFPGGRLDPEDARVPIARDLAPDVPAAMRLATARARALAIAAVRETAEETGLLLGLPGDVGARAGEAWGLFRDAGLAPDLGALSCIARAITPVESPIRFHARFFQVPGERLSGTLGGSGELLDLAWLDLDQALALPLMDVTEAVLRALGRGAPLFLSYRHGRLLRRGAGA